jgi:predicted transposase YbfD/YdcC
LSKKTFEIVTGQGNQMIAQVKANQAALLAAAQQAAQTPALSQACQFNHERSRIERREVKVFAAAALPADWAPLIKAVVQVYRHIDGFDTRSGDWRLRTETAYYLASEVRGHWGIENRQHYVRDVTLREDASRIRRNPGIFARLRSFTLNVLRRNNITNISEALYDNALNLDNLRGYVGVF